MIWLLLAAVIVIGVCLLRNILPVHGLTPIHPDDLKVIARDQEDIKMLDVRDPVDYLREHENGTVNISLGRLPYLWKKELSTSEPVVILGGSSRQSKQAARFLKRVGFRQLYIIKDDPGRKNRQGQTGTAVCCSDCCR
ncbi:rhodanese-like domain-containing protein [Paenibacillus cineris]|uniref:rhodanese-like domain-containing protein n=1 Tax=Paenibacillus cineris TaxID=237530 RepID=UPI001B259758|nr:rhodanese-like domain-containing protein [Paenibacillus cineris]GIO60806.1 hypothetical protein J43TS9_23800 [Paenibacillus cineris]